MNTLLVQPAPAVVAGGARPSGDSAASKGSPDAFDHLLNDALNRKAPARPSSSDDDRAPTSDAADRPESTGRAERSDRAERPEADRADDADATDADADATESADEAEATEQTEDTETTESTDDEATDEDATESATGEPATPTVDPAITMAELAPTVSVEVPTEEGTTAATGDIAERPVDMVDEQPAPAAIAEDTEAGTVATPVAVPTSTTPETDIQTAETPRAVEDLAARGPIAVTTEAELDEATEAVDAESEVPDAAEALPGQRIDRADGEPSADSEDSATADDAKPRSALATPTLEASEADAPTASPPRTSDRVEPVAAPEGTRPTSALAEPVSASTTTEAAATLSTADVDSAGTDNALFRQVHRALSNIRLNAQGEQTLTIRLHPEELGSITVKVTAAEHGVRIGLVTDTAAAAGHLANQRQLLEQELSESGLDGASVDVSHGGASNGEGRPGDDSSSGGAANRSASALAADRAERRVFRSATSGISTIDLDL